MLFDLDGTLTDTFELWYRAVAGLVERHAGIHLRRDEYRARWWGMDGRGKIREILRPRDDQVECLYRELVSLLMAKVSLVRPLPGAREAIEALARYVPLAVISNGPAAFLNAQLAHVGLDHLFSAKVADAEPKPSPAGIFRACEALGVHPGEVVFVGDSQFDTQAATNAGVKCIVIPEEQ
ncbi:MAG: HAD-IA family hydrolase, partial [Armatimonadetes bacterium]|nr:HAD-IA family hydrolase [Armatimonadota bacterium]